MDNLRTLLTKAATDAIEAAYDEKQLADVAQSDHADYQCNNALRLAKLLKKNPREVAQTIIDNFKSDLISSLDIAGPGFINIHLNQEGLSKQLTEIFLDPHLGVPQPDKKERIVVDFSSPNVAKELHVGHLRSTIIGDAIARLFEFLGHDVLRLNHIGDWGTQFGMLITYLKEHKLDENADLSDLMHWYKEAKKCFDADPDFKKRSQGEVIALQSGEKDARRIWEQVCAISRKAYREIYEMLDVDLIDRGESFYNPMLEPTVSELKEKGLLTLSEGAQCIFLDGYKIPMIVQKSDGGFNYTTTDIAALKHRILEEKADRIIIVTDGGQRLHIEMIFKMAEKLGLPKTALDHVYFGVVLGADGKKFKTRSGETEKLKDLLDKAVDMARGLLKERGMNEEDARILGIDAVKYADLSNQRIKDYVFSYERMLRFEGNTAAFILYSYVRVQGIKRKVGRKDISGTIHLEHPSEIALGLHLRRFGETLEDFSRDLMPHRLTDYLYSLAEKFNAFFRDCHVQGTPEEESRLLLAELTARILKKGLELLGLKVLDQM
ncbi:MAG: Arginine--tRNA ligase [Chlamydiia bacterium]|nr:Arginine--tRNA ligase [Chlamydiia bacterium]MCH9616492.1 Arginine--tRNA ligase [Chlamydiia bacterium]MCH9629522.1 Arginine--tRNA ligase [Chlamydiia bacterium]